MSVPSLRGNPWKLDAVGQGQGIPDTYYVYSTFTAAATDIVTMAGHGFNTGDGPVRLTTSGADLPLNLLTGTDYWIERIDANTFYLHREGGRWGQFAAATRVDIGDAGTGTHTLNVSSFFIDNPDVGNGRPFFVKNIVVVGNGTNAGTVDLTLGTATAPLLTAIEVNAALSSVVIPIYSYVPGIYVSVQDATGARIQVYHGRF
jgi:hypothetical protein